MNARDNEDQTALHRAIKNFQIQVAEFLVHICDVNIKDSKGQTALHLATERGCDSVTKLLLKI